MREGGGGAEVRSPNTAAEAGGESADPDLHALLEIVSVKHEENDNQEGKVCVASEPPAGCRLEAGGREQTFQPAGLCPSFVCSNLPTEKLDEK